MYLAWQPYPWCHKKSLSQCVSWKMCDEDIWDNVLTNQGEMQLQSQNWDELHMITHVISKQCSLFFKLDMVSGHGQLYTLYLGKSFQKTKFQFLILSTVIQILKQEKKGWTKSSTKLKTGFDMQAALNGSLTEYRKGCTQVIISPLACKQSLLSSRLEANALCWKILYVEKSEEQACC